jgi:hypothetical protein
MKFIPNYKTDCHDIAKILLNVALNIITSTRIVHNNNYTTKYYFHNHHKLNTILIQNKNVDI